MLVVPTAVYGSLKRRVASLPVGFTAVAVALMVTSAAWATLIHGNAGTETTASSSVEDYPDAITRELNRRMHETRPVPNSALPPRHLDTERFPEILVDRFRIVSGGPPPDGIRSIDAPRFIEVDDVDWLAPDESVLALAGRESVHVYPTQIMLWHEIVNDEIDGRPVTVTYCPLCNSAVAFDRRSGDKVLDFGTSGALYHSALVMYDRQTESLWTHFDGRAVVGDLMGRTLEPVAVQTLSWSDATARWPTARVLDRPVGALGQRPYGTSPYPNYEGLDEPLPGFFQAEPDPRLPARQRVVGLLVDGEALAVDRRVVERQGTIIVDVAGQEVRLDHSSGVRSPLDNRQVADGVDIGAITATGAAGTAAPVPVIDTFWFAWAAYYPETALITD